MKTHNSYLVDIVGLEDGEHLVEFKISSSFFDRHTEVISADMSVEITLTKIAQSINCSFCFNGVVDVLCDRCNEKLSLPLSFNKSLLFKFAEDEGELNEDIVCIQASSTNIDFSQYIYEFITLELPMKKTHRNNECNKNVIAYLNNHNSRQVQTPDPRWDELQNLKL